MSPTAPPPPPPPPSSNKKWIFWGCGGCLVLAIIIAAVVGLGGFGLFKKISGMIKESPAYVEAVQRVQASPAVQAELGTPISDSFATGSINTVNDKTHAVIAFKVDGPKGTGMVGAEAEYSGGGPVQFSKLQVVANGKTIDLLAP
jgi:Cytochrome oxidase complex assembly protein 1